MGDRPSLRRLAVELENLGTDPAPPPRPAFVEALEGRLRGISDSPVMVPAPTAETTRRRPLAPVAVFAAVALLAGLAVGRTAGERSVRSFAPAATTGPAGTAGSPVATEGQTQGGAAATSTAPQATTGRGANAVPSAAAQAATTSPPHEAVGPPEAAAGDLSLDPVEASTRPVGAFGLRGSGTPARIFLDWDVYEGDDFGAYLVLRSIAPDDPQWPAPNDRTLVMRRIESRSEVTFDDTPKVGTTTRWRVVVVDSRGELVSRSNVVTPTESPAMRTPAVSA